MEREKKLAKNIFILGIGKVIPKCISLITLPIITFYLTKDEFGKYDLITILVTLFLPIVTLQMQAAAFRFLLNKKDKKDKRIVISNIMYFTLFSSTIALTILFFILFKIDIITRIIIITYYLLDIYLITIQQIARGLSNNKEYSSSVVLSSIAELAFTFTFVAYFKLGLIGILITLILSDCISLLYLCVKIKLFSYVKISLLSRNVIREFLSYSWPLIPNSLSSWIMQLSDRVIISLFLGVGANAIYAVANKIPNLFNILQGTFNMAWQESASLAVDSEDSNDYYSRMFSVTFNAYVGMMALVIGFAPILFFLLIRGDYSQSYRHIAILFMGNFFSGISSYIGGIYIAHKKSKEIGLTTIGAAIVNLIINVSLIHFIGIYAASISTMVSYLFLAIYRMKDVQKIQKIKYNFKQITMGLILLATMCIINFVTNNFLNIINVILGVTVFLVFNKNIVMKFTGIFKEKLVSKRNCKI